MTDEHTKELENTARAMCSKDNVDPDGIDDRGGRAPELNWKRYREAARSAIIHGKIATLERCGVV